MNRNSVTGRRKWRLSSKLYLLVALIVVSTLIYLEQSALLYVVSTLAVSIIMLVVAFAKLEEKDKDQHEISAEKVSAESERIRKRA